MLRHRPDGINGTGVKSVPGIFGDESAMRLDLGNADQFCEVGDLTQSINARSARGRGNQADGGWTA
jgi:hypothetical protein